MNYTLFYSIICGFCSHDGNSLYSYSGKSCSAVTIFFAIKKAVDESFPNRFYIRDDDGYSYEPDQDQFLAMI